MSYNRAYAIGDQVRVDKYGIDPFPTKGPCTIPATITEESSQRAARVTLRPEGYEDTYLVYKDRVMP